MKAWKDLYNSTQLNIHPRQREKSEIKKKWIVNRKKKNKIVHNKGSGFSHVLKDRIVRLNRKGNKMQLRAMAKILGLNESIQKSWKR